MKTRILIAAITVLSVLAITGCEETTVNNPTGPSEKPEAKPQSNNSAVLAQDAGVCATPPCVADFGVAKLEPETIAWLFTGGAPPTSPAPAGNVQWPSIGTKNWSSQLCNDVGCTAAQGTVRFVSAATAVQLAVESGALNSAFSRLLEERIYAEGFSWGVYSLVTEGVLTFSAAEQVILAVGRATTGNETPGHRQ